MDARSLAVCHQPINAINHTLASEERSQSEGVSATINHSHQPSLPQADI